MNNQNSISKILYPVFFIITAVSLYFLYSIFFSTEDMTANGNNILKNTKLGVAADIINKENISFNSNTVDYFNNTKNFSLEISPSQSNGRENPFLP